MNHNPENEAECCPKFDPTPWDDKFVEWDRKMFVKTHVCTAFYMPLNFGQKMRKSNALIEKSGAMFLDGMALSAHPSPWRMDLYLAVDKPVAGIENTEISGKFYTRVYDGPFGKIDKWMKNFKEMATAKNLAVKEWFIWYTTCPKCAKKYGHNYVVILGKL